MEFNCYSFLSHGSVFTRTVFSSSPAFFSSYLFVSYLLVILSLMGLYRVFSFFLGFMWILGRILAPLMLINGDTTISLHRYIPHWWYTLSAGDERYTHVWCDKAFPGRFPRFLMLSSFSRRLVAMPSHHHLTPHFDHQNQNPQLSLYRAFHVLIITVCIAFMSRPRHPPLYSCIVFSSVPCTPLFAKKTPSLCTFGHSAQTNVRPSRPTNLTDLKDPNIGCNL